MIWKIAFFLLVIVVVFFVARFILWFCSDEAEREQRLTIEDYVNRYD